MSMRHFPLLVLLIAGPLAAAEPVVQHWAYRPLEPVRPPAVSPRTLARNPIDRFVLEKLKMEGIVPSAAADRGTLIRRVTLDLTGLLPTPSQVDAFLADTSPDAFRRVVDRLLASPRYGEHWAREWMDLSHYADSDGYLTDQLRPVAWRYRQWLIEQLNADTPFDLFTRRQLAGDLIENASLEDRLGTGFLRQTLSNREGGADPEEFRVKQVIDRTEMVSTIWLGLTLGCARCHDHKYDSLLQREFFQLYSFLNTADEVNIYAPLSGEAAAWRDAVKTYNQKRDKLLAPVAEQIEKLQDRWEARLLDAAAHPGRDHYWDRTWEVLGLIWGGNLGEGQLEGWEIVKRDRRLRTREEQDRLLLYFLSHGERTDPQRFKELKLGESRDKLQKLRDEVPWPTRAQVMQQAQVPRQAFLHERGDFRERGSAVTSGVPAVLPPMTESRLADRMALARWLFSPEHPLTARVTVNRMWQAFFGTGLVRTADDFGVRGEHPSHPGLLDWLALEFRDRGWSVKRMHRLIVTSAAYRRDSRDRQDLAERDPFNRLLARQRSLRFSAEQVRDVALEVSGLINSRLTGPSVKPPQPESVSQEAYGNKWAASTGADRFCRGLYTFVQRTSPFAQGTTFDVPSPGKTCTRRERSNTPLQALTLLNDPVFFECAQGLAARVLQEAHSGDEARIDRIVKLCLSRKPRAEERRRLKELLDRQQWLFAGGDPQAAETAGRVAGPAARVRAPDEAAAWVAVASVIMNLHEFITRD